MQAALRDLTPTRVTNPRPFAICQRVLHGCHEIIFGDPPEPSRSPYRSLPHSPPASASVLLSPSSVHARRTGVDEKARPGPVRVNQHVLPAMLGMGVMLAGPGMKGLTDLAGEWAVLQGRKPRDDEDEGRARVEVEKGGGADMPAARSITGRKASEEMETSDEEKTPSLDPRTRSTSERGRAGELNNVQAIPITVNRSHQASTTPNLYSPPLLSTPVLSQHRSVSPSPSLRPKGEDPFSQEPSSPPQSGPSRPSTPPRLPHQPFHSVPELLSHSAVHRRREHNDRQFPSGNLLAAYSIDAQRQLLRSHYCRTQVRFLLLLEDISNRLLVVPKPARVSALRAELTSLNHNLPAEVSSSPYLRRR